MHGLRRLFLTCTFALGPAAFAQTQAVALHTAPDPHSTQEWLVLQPHLPDPVTASPDKLEMTADVLRARRFSDDAITYYKAAAINGGNSNRLLKKQGVVHLEMQHGLIARLCFQQAVHLNKKDAEAWNNLGAADFMLGNTHAAVSEYKHAVKLNRDSAVYHSNLALAYFEQHNGRSARQELAKAFAIDPEILHHANNGGYNLQVLASTHYAEICYEMARASAAQGDQETTISWLTKATDRGFDVRAAMKDDALLAPYLQNQQVKLMLANSDQMHTRPVAGKMKPPSLGDKASMP